MAFGAELPSEAFLVATLLAVTGAVTALSAILWTVHRRREQNARFREVTDHIREVFYQHDATGTRLLYISPAYEEIWGRSCSDLYQNPLSWIEAIVPEVEIKSNCPIMSHCESIGVPKMNAMGIPKTIAPIRNTAINPIARMDYS